MEQRRSQVPVIALQGLAALAPELPGAALVSRFLKSAQAEWEKLKPKAETLEKLQAWKSLEVGCFGAKKNDPTNISQFGINWFSRGGGELEPS